MATLALILYVQQTANTGTAVGLLLLSGSAGPLLAPLMGVVADRVDRRVVLVTCAVGQAVVVGLMAGLLPSWQVLLAFVFAGSLLATPSNRPSRPFFLLSSRTRAFLERTPCWPVVASSDRSSTPLAGLLYPLSTRVECS